MRKAILIAVTGAIILGGSLAVLAQDEASDESERPVRQAVVEVLAELVEDGTLTQAQADAVGAALEMRRDEFRAERAAARQQLEEFWADDQLTTDEIDQLPDWHRWRGVSQIWEDGVVTRDELRNLWPARHRRLR